MQKIQEYDASVAISLLRFDGEGSGEKEAYTYRGRVTDGEEYSLFYVAKDEGGEQQTTLCFAKDAPCKLTLLQQGTVNCRLAFSEGERSRALYRIEGVGELDMEILTRTVKNEERGRERRIRLDYEATVGGARMRTVMTLAVTKENS